MENKAWAQVVSIIVFAIIFFGSMWFMTWIFRNLTQIGIGMLSVAVPFLLIVIGAVLIKKYLLER